MESFKSQFPPHSTEQYFMNPIPSIFRATQCLRLASKKFRCLSSSSHNITTTQAPISGTKGKTSALRKSGRVGAKLSDGQLKGKWLDSLTCPVDGGLSGSDGDGTDARPGNVGSEWVIGVDPDVSGALAVLKSDGLGLSAQVFDSPQLKVLVGRKIRRRLDAKSLILLVQSLNAPLGTTAYIEQSIPYPQDGKQGWWGGGFGYGLWIGILVASGFSVVPVPSMLWKKGFRLSRSRSSKDDSRELASALFPSLSSQLTRKKDHGRAEAVLIAAYGKGLKLSSDSSCTSEELTSQEPEDCHVLLTAQESGVC